MSSESDIKEFKLWHDNGSIWRHEFYKNGNLEGMCKVWHANGTLSSRAIYRNGRLDGEYKQWYKNGRIEEREFYRNERLDGERKEWYDNGQLYEREFYQNGKLKDGKWRQSWDYNGGTSMTMRRYRQREVDWCFIPGIIFRQRRRFRTRIIRLLNTVLISDLSRSI